MVLANPPGEPTQTVSLPAPMLTQGGELVSSVTVSAGSGAILTASTAPAPVGNPAPPVPAPPVPTQTVLATTVKQTPTPGSAPYTPPSHTGKKEASSSSSSTPPPARSSRHRQTARASSAQRLSATHRRASPVRFARISGHVRHATRGRVTVQVQALRDHRWVDVRAVKLDVGRAGRFGRRLRLRGAGRYRVRAIYSGASGYGPSRSAYHVLTLHIH